MTRLKLGMVGGGQGAFIGAVHRIASRIDGPVRFWSPGRCHRMRIGAAASARQNWGSLRNEPMRLMKIWPVPRLRVWTE